LEEAAPRAALKTGACIAAAAAAAAAAAVAGKRWHRNRVSKPMAAAMACLFASMGGGE